MLAYATTIAGAQGRTTDRSHVLVTPRTTAQSLYVGMTRGRQANTAHVVCDAHDHDELRLGERAPRDAFLAAMQRDSDGNLSAHTIAQRWHQQRAAREAARAADRQLQYAEAFWSQQIRNWPSRLREDLAGSQPEIVRVLARLSTDSERASVVAQALRLAPSGYTSSTDFVNALHRWAAGTPQLSTSVDAQRAGHVHGPVR